MKRVFVALGSVLAFTGIASLALFFVMSPSSITGVADTVSNWASNIGGGNSKVGLTADIGGVLSSGNDAGGGTVATADTGPATTAAIPDAAPSTTPATSITPAETASPNDVPATSTAPADAVSPSSPAVPDLPEATATIMVTPTAPLPPGTLAAGTPAQTAGADSVALPYRETDFAGDARWQLTWGVADITNTGALSLSAGANSLGGAIHFAGGSWSNYAMSAAIDLVSGRTFSLVANYVDASNNVFCEYSEAAPGAINIQLKQDVRGYVTAVSPVSTVPVTNGIGLETSITVVGAYGTCSLNGASVSNEGVGAGKSALTAAQSGGVGFAVNDPTANTSHVIVHEISIAAK